MLLALGPVRARFGGAAALSYDNAARSGGVQGAGPDQASGTRLNAAARFQVLPEGEGACVLAVSVEYGLRGALSQLARGRVVDLLAAEIAGVFAHNLAARLDGGTAAAPAALSGGRLLLRLAWLRLRQLLGR